ncbi:DUF3263 domain-containing protein [Nocardioides bruguierae]|uniref:DUF3263 domain-containing protein n=1 Tax=Nocardioides bruguierae TaxID=2945102 RepID=A0A9X2DDS5_9ACTN|nr:DUF3263 domain-containing protein [Nocardioides bruguierae]MCM0622604.1 DUF3263 domain-containing protein [Nocardioides bruguierae]
MTDPTSTSKHGAEAGQMPDRLGARDYERLEFGRLRFKHAGAKETAVYARWRESLTKFVARFNALLDHPDALAYDPATVTRERRLRALRAHARRNPTGPQTALDTHQPQQAQQQADQSGDVR